jgi:ligand-binding sensor domain-containing protein
MRFSCIYIVFSLLFLIKVPVYSQEVTLDRFSTFVNLSVTNGLAHNTVNDIIQDHNGFMWFATENGLSRYDGYSFVNFFHNPDDPNSIAGNSILTLATDNSNNLWIGTTEGLCQLNLKTGVIKRFMTQMGNRNSPRSNHIRKLLFSNNSKILWIETFGGTLTAYNSDSQTWSHYSHQSSTQPYYRYHALYEDRDANIWVGGRNTPIHRFSETDNSFHIIQAKGLENRGKRDNDLAAIIQTSKDNWFVMGLDGIYEFYPKDETFDKIHSTSTYGAAEDDQGNVWFASGFGLLKYAPNKNHYTAFRNNKNNPNSIVHSHINKIYIDKVGNIWTGTRNGVSLLNQKSKTITHLYHIPGDDNSLSANEISAIAQDKNGTIYIGTANNGVNLWELGEPSIQQVSAEQKNTNGLLSDRISTIYSDSEGILWLGLWSGLGFNSYNPNTKTFKRYQYNSTTLRYDWYNAFLELPNGEFIAGMWGANGAIYFDRKKGEFTDRIFLNYNKPYNRPVDEIISDGQGNIFMRGLNAEVIYRYNSESNRYTSHAFNPHPIRGDISIWVNKTNLPFAFTSFNCMASDGKGFSVFATNTGIISWDRDNGLNALFQGKLNPIDIKVHHNKIYLLQNNNLTVFDRNGAIENEITLDEEYHQILFLEGNKILLVGNQDFSIVKPSSEIGLTRMSRIRVSRLSSLSITCLNNNYIWIGSPDGLYRHAVSTSQDLFKKESTIEQIIDIPISHILPINDSTIYAFSSLGVYKVNSARGESNLIEITNIPEGFVSAVRTATLVKTDIIWVGTESGFYKLNINSGEIIDLNLPDENSVSSHLVSTLLYDNSGNIWIGTTDRGLNRVDSKTGKVKHFFSPSLPSNRINSILQSKEGWIWVATDKGICYIIDDFVMKVSDVSAQYDVRSIVEDDNEFIWAGTNNGLLAINPVHLEVTHFNEYQGLPTSDFSKAALKLSDGMLAFGSSKGFVSFDPKTLLNEQDFSSEVHFTRFSILGNSHHHFFGVSDTIKLNHNQNFFELSFSSSDYSLKTGATFRYKLDKVNSTWNTSQTGNVSYTNVRPGRYLFEVSKMLPNGKPSTNVTSLLIWIKPAIWQTLWFRLSILLLILAGLSIYIFTYIRQLKAARLNVELEQRLLISQMNPHFIFNSLSAIQSFMYRNQPEEAGNYLSSFSRLVRLILENSRSASIPIKQEVQTLELYFSLQKLRFPGKFEYHIDVDPDLLHSDIALPPMLAQPFIENSIEHGIMHMVGKGTITVEFSVSKGVICIVVEDDGIGVEKSMLINQGKRLTHTSYATSITCERIKNISKRAKDGFGVKIVDKKTFGETGTRVEIRLPISSENGMNLKTTQNDTSNSG